MTSILNRSESRLEPATKQHGLLVGLTTGLLHLQCLIDPNAKLKFLYGQVAAGNSRLQNMMHDNIQEATETGVQRIGDIYQMFQDGREYVVGVYHNPQTRSTHIVCANPGDRGVNIFHNDLELIGKTLDHVDYSQRCPFPFTVQPPDSIFTISIKENEISQLQFKTLAYGDTSSFPKGVPILSEDQRLAQRDRAYPLYFPVRSNFAVPMQSEYLNNYRVGFMIGELDRARKLLNFVNTVTAGAISHNQKT